MNLNELIWLEWTLGLLNILSAPLLLVHLWMSRGSDNNSGKLEFEKQIMGSVKAGKSMWINLFGKTKHPLLDATVSAMCRDIRTHSVLFDISSQTIKQSFVIIDLIASKPPISTL